MLVALTENGNRIYADEAQKRDANGNKNKFYCPDCGSELTLKQGSKNIWHFSHKDGNTICLFRKGKSGESIIHQTMKKKIKEIIERDNDVVFSELEWKIGSRIADYYCEIRDARGNIRKVAVECVYRHNDIDEFTNKSEYYFDREIYCLWIFNLTRFLNKDNSFKEEVRVNEIIKKAHTAYFGKVFALDIANEVIYAIHLSGILRETESVTLYDELGNGYDVGGNSYFLRGTKSPDPVLIGDLSLTKFARTRADGYLDMNRSVCMVDLAKWW
ncbi:competence protein CoiA [uncultured Methanobrevibacter sp.]|uniref:competence protein CoiA n=1 Tax=uncultured Methanobrevibacter sp. TaxID=253161 RepID=UPI0025F55F8D|nr:competence protein CoiA family protein [uncultured Methanobrevibacter sp.]